MTTFFTSDTHYDHRNVVVYCNRPYVRFLGSLTTPQNLPLDEDHLKELVDVEAMNEEMIRNWNAVVGPEDVVYHLGDFHLGKKERMKAILPRLAGQKILVLGNHDRSAKSMIEAGFDEVHTELIITLDGKRLYLHHQPMPTEWWKDLADLHLCGHVHEAWLRQGDVINVGVDQWDFTPVTLDKLLQAPSTERTEWYDEGRDRRRD